MAGRRRRSTRLDRIESPFGAHPAVLEAWERQRQADPRKYGINRYPDFFQTDMLEALQRRHGLSVLNYTPLAGIGEAGNVLAATLLRDGGELVQPWPVDDPIARAAVGWGGKVRRVALDRMLRQDLEAMAAAVGPRTRLVHLQNPHDPCGRSFGQGDLESFLAAVSDRNPDTYVWVDETHAEWSLRGDFPDSFALIDKDRDHSRLIASRSLSSAGGIPGVPVAYLAASTELTGKTNGVTKGFFVPDAYGWTNPEANVSRMGEKALLTMLGPAGDEHFARVRELNRVARSKLEKTLLDHGFLVTPSDACWVFAKAPRAGVPAGIRVHRSKRWGKRYRRHVRVGVSSERELERLARAFPRKRTLAAGAAAAAVATTDLKRAISRRTFIAGSAALLAAAQVARAFPPDGFYDEFSLARMIYHENPLGPSPAALEAVRAAIARGPLAAAHAEPNDDRALVDAVLAYNRRRTKSVDRLSAKNVMLLCGSAEGLMLVPDTFVAGGTMVTEWPCYRIIRERVLQQGGTLLDVPLKADNTPDYDAMRKALADHPETGLVHFNAQNNPMGTVLQRGPFDEFAKHVFERHPNTVILVDESDREWMEPGQAERMPNFLGFVARGQNLVHLQTFSHVFGLTGLRVGYLMAPARLVERMKLKRTARPVNVLGRVAALAALKDADAQIERCRRLVSEGRSYLYSELDKMGLKYAPSQGHYVMLDTGVSGTAVWSELIAQGVLTRYGREWGKEGWLRVNPGLPEENERFIASLRAALGKVDPANPPSPPVPVPGTSAEAALIRRDLERRLTRDAWIEARMPPLERPYRLVTPDRFRR